MDRNDTLACHSFALGRVMNNQKLLSLSLSFLIVPVVFVFSGCSAPIDGGAVVDATETSETASSEELASVTTKLTDANASLETATAEIKQLKTKLTELKQQKADVEKKLNEKVASLTKTLNATATKMSSVAESTSQSQTALTELNGLLAAYSKGEPKKPEAAATAPAVVPHAVAKPRTIAKPRAAGAIAKPRAAGPIAKPRAVAKPAVKKVQKAPEQMPQSLKKK